MGAKYTQSAAAWTVPGLSLGARVKARKAVNHVQTDGLSGTGRRVIQWLSLNHHTRVCTPPGPCPPIMPLDPESLRPAIRAILMASDLATVSTRTVRTELCKSDESLDPAEIKANKAAIDSIIAELFEDLREDTPPPEPAKKKIKKEESGAAAQELADAKLARELSRSLNGLPPGRSTRGGGGAEKLTSSSKTKKSKKIADGKKVMSAAKVDSDGEPISVSVSDEDGNDGEAEAGKKRKRGGGGGAFNKEMGLSEQLSAVLDGESRLSRPQVVKRLWAYIKENELQDPKDKRYIFCDDPLKAIFKTPKIHMMTMNKTLSSHLYPLED